MHKNAPKRYASKQDQYFDLIELQAHRFAGAFLFPSKPFSMETVGLSLDLFKVLKQRWKVSIGVQIKRAENLGFITGEEASQLWRNYRRRGWSKREPFDLEIPVERTKALKDSIELVVNHGVQDKFSLISTLQLPHSEMEKITGLNPNYLTGEVAELVTLKSQNPCPPASDNPNKSKADVIRFPRRM